jgi:hypothetical protein
MGTINISSTEETTIKDFKEGNSVQVRVTVSPNEEKEFAKGKTVKVLCDGSEATGKIVSDPLIVRTKNEDGKETLSLIVEKTWYKSATRSDCVLIINSLLFLKHPASVVNTVVPSGACGQSPPTATFENQELRRPDLTQRVRSDIDLMKKYIIYRTQRSRRLQWRSHRRPIGAYLCFDLKIRGQQDRIFFVSAVTSRCSQSANYAEIVGLTNERTGTKIGVLPVLHADTRHFLADLNSRGFRQRKKELW